MLLYLVLFITNTWYFTAEDLGNKISLIKENDFPNLKVTGINEWDGI